MRDPYVFHFNRTTERGAKGSTLTFTYPIHSRHAFHHVRISAILLVNVLRVKSKVRESLVSKRSFCLSVGRSVVLHRNRIWCCFSNSKHMPNHVLRKLFISSYGLPSLGQPFSFRTPRSAQIHRLRQPDHLSILALQTVCVPNHRPCPTQRYPAKLL